MKQKIYRIRHWINDIDKCEWDIYANDDQDAQEECEYLRFCCRRAGIEPVLSEILSPEHTAKLRRIEKLRV